MSDLADFDYLLQPGSHDPVEYIPVDDWFDQYLQTLNFAEDGEPAAGMAKGARIEAKEQDFGDADAGGNDTGGATDTSTLYGASPQESGSPQSGGGGGTVTSSKVPAVTISRSGSEASGGASMPVTPQGGYASHVPPAGLPPIPIGAPPITSGGGPVTSGAFPVTSGSVVSGQSVGAPPPVMSGGAIVSGMPDQLTDRKVQQPKQKRKRVRDERQQMLNKLAQIRYRERKRGKQNDLQGDINALEAQLAELRVRQAENADLTQQNRALEAQLEEKDASIAKAQRRPGGAAAAATSSGDAGSPTAAADGPERGALPRDTPEDLDRLVKDWLAKSKEIMNLVELIGLGDGNKSSLGRLKNDVKRSVRKTFSPKTRDVLQHVETRMGEMVSDVSSLCMRVMRLQGAQVQQLMTADYEMVCSMKGWKDEGKWLKAARDLNFTPEQRKRLLAARDESLGKLHQLYGERQGLNTQVLYGLQPGLFTMGANDGATTAAAKQMVQLLDALGANLAAEQQELARQDWVLFRQLLTPIQSGLLVAISFPDHCDALALMNAVHTLALSS